MHRSFALLEKKYGDPAVYLFETKTKMACIVAIPSWNWSFCIDYSFPHEVVKSSMAKALTDRMWSDDADALSEEIYTYVINEM